MFAALLSRELLRKIPMRIASQCRCRSHLHLCPGYSADAVITYISALARKAPNVNALVNDLQTQVRPRPGFCSAAVLSSIAINNISVLHKQGHSPASQVQ